MFSAILYTSHLFQFLNKVAVVASCWVLLKLGFHDLQGPCVLSATHGFFSLCLSFLGGLARLYVLGLILLLLLLEFLQLLLNELIIKLRIGVLRIELHGAVIVLQRFLPALAAFCWVGSPFTQMIEGVALVVVCERLQLQVRRGQGLVELFDRGLKFLVFVGCRPGVEMEARVVAVPFKRLIVFAGLVLPQRAGRRSRSRGR